MRIIPVVFTLFCIQTIAADAIPAYQIHIPRGRAPAKSPEFPPAAPAPTFPPAESPNTDLPVLEDGIFDVTEHGAIADGVTENSAAFVEAWENACAYPRSSTFYIPKGTFLLGPVQFSGPCYGNQSPNIEIRGTLIALTSLEDFPSSNWVIFKNLYSFNLTGGNNVVHLNGRGEVEAWEQKSCSKSEKCDRLVTSLRFINVSSGAISDIDLSNSKGFHVGLHGCNNITLRNVRIRAPRDSPNTDGIHVSHSTNIHITSSDIGVGDDCVSIGPGSFNIFVSDVSCGPGHGISIGSLGKYPNEKDVRGITVRNCTINGTENGIRVKTWPGANASNAADFTFEDITMINVSNPIIIDQEYCPSKKCNISEPSLLKVSDIRISNISGTYSSKYGLILLCSSEVACENIELSDIRLNYTKREIFQQGKVNAKGAIDGLKIVRSSF